MKKVWTFISLQWLLYVLNLSAARGKGVGAIHVNPKPLGCIHYVSWGGGGGRERRRVLGGLNLFERKGGMVLEISEGWKGDCQFFWMLLKDKYLQEPSWYL